MNKLLAIVAGEPESVNSEIIAKTWKKFKSNKNINFFIIGNFSLLSKQLKKLKIKINLYKLTSVDNINNNKKLYVYDVALNFTDPFKIDSKAGSNYVLKCLDLADKLAKNKTIYAFINCPVNKQKIFKNKKIGVTEYLARKSKLQQREVMLIYNNELAVAPITTHIKIKAVAKSISILLIKKKIRTIDSFYIKYFNKRPDIAILGLNPHNDEYRKDSEEYKIIIPAIKNLKSEGFKVHGPYSADTIFNNKKKYNYDVIVGMYHDQVLAPFKTKYNFDAINITLGLNYLRVSPDHGVAKDLIKKNKANPNSLINSIRFFSKIKR